MRHAHAFVTANAELLSTRTSNLGVARLGKCEGYPQAVRGL